MKKYYIPVRYNRPSTNLICVEADSPSEATDVARTRFLEMLVANGHIEFSEPRDMDLKKISEASILHLDKAPDQEQCKNCRYRTPAPHEDQSFCYHTKYALPTSSDTCRASPHKYHLADNKFWPYCWAINPNNDCPVYEHESKTLETQISSP